MNSNRPRRLSATFIRTVTRPGRYGDGRGGYGLSLLVRPTTSGGVSRSWTQRLKVHGRFRYMGLGSFPLVTLAEAREQAFENARAVRAGADLRANRRRRALIPTFQDAVDQVIALHAANWKEGSRTAGIWRARLRNYVFPAIGQLPIDVVTSAQVLDVLKPLWATRREVARKIRQYIHATMAWAIAQGFRNDNPAGDHLRALLPKGRFRRVHQRAIPFAEVASALAQIRGSDAYEMTKLAIAFLTLTACRSGEVRGACWTEIDDRTATWTIPGFRMKSGREHRVPLSTAALAVLDRTREYAEGSSLCFPSLTGRVLSDNALSKLFRDLGIKGTPHGMRLSFRVWATECSDAPWEVAELALASIESSVLERAYRHSDLFDRQRQLMQRWAEHCMPSEVGADTQ